MSNGAIETTVKFGVSSFSFTYDCRDLDCTFIGSASDDGAVAGWSWDYGDGESGVGSATQHSFASPGVYTVSLDVVDRAGATLLVIRAVAVGMAADPPDSSAKSTSSTTATATTTLSDSTSTSTVVTTTPQTATYAPVGSGYAFGPFVVELRDLGTKYTGGWLTVYINDVTETLNAVRAAGASVAVNIVRSKKHYKNPDGTFNLDMWKAMVDVYAGFDFAPWVEDGTVFAHYLIDEPKARSEWGGEVIPNEVLEEMARYSKGYWPMMPTTVRVQPTTLKDHGSGYEQPLPGWTWTYLDSGWAQYSARKGPIDAYVLEETAEAKAQGLGLVFGLNVLTGGAGPDSDLGWDVAGLTSGTWSMSPTELRRYGAAMIGERSSCGFILWRYYDADTFSYFDRVEIDSAIHDLGLLAAGRARKPCLGR